MRKGLALILLCGLITVALYLLMPPNVERTCIYYGHTSLQAQGESHSPAPSSIFAVTDDLRLSLLYIVKHKQYAINRPQTDRQSYTEVALLLEQLSSKPLNKLAEVQASIEDDLGITYQLASPAEIITNKELGTAEHVLQYLLSFPPLNHQAVNVMIHVRIGTDQFVLVGATIP